MATDDQVEDIDAMLEAPYSKDRNGGQSRSSQDNADDLRGSRRSSKHSRSRSPKSDDRRRRRRSDSRERNRRNEDSHSRSRESNRDQRPRSRERREQERHDTRDRDRDRDRDRRRTPPSPPRRRSPPPRRVPGPERRDVMPFTPRYSPPRGAIKLEDLSPEERDARTVFCMQLSARTRPRDLEEFFSAVGKVRDVRIITDSKTKRSKGIAYVEFYDMESVTLALGLHGQRLLGAPIIVQPTQSEKNRAASATLATGFASFAQASGPMKLYVGSLHFNITEDMLRGIFEPFGRIDNIQLLKDTETNRSRGYGFITFHNAEDAKRAMEQLNGFELAGRAMKVGHVTEHQPTGGGSGGGGNLDSDELDRQGIDLGTTGRLQLMAKLAEGTGMQLPSYAQQMLQASQTQVMAAAAPPIATQCFMLSNMFDPTQEAGPNWDVEIRDDVIEECNKNGGVLHIFVDKASPQGNVYVKCPSIASAVAAVNSLHGRWFAGKIITANYVPVVNYHQLFPDAMSSTLLLKASTR